MSPASIRFKNIAFVLRWIILALVIQLGVDFIVELRVRHLEQRVNAYDNRPEGK